MSGFDSFVAAALHGLRRVDVVTATGSACRGLAYSKIDSELPYCVALCVPSRHVKNHSTSPRLLSGPILQLVKEGDCAWSTFGLTLRRHCALVQIGTPLGHLASDEKSKS